MCVCVYVFLPAIFGRSIYIFESFSLRALPFHFGIFRLPNGKHTHTHALHTRSHIHPAHTLNRKSSSATISLGFFSLPKICAQQSRAYTTNARVLCVMPPWTGTHIHTHTRARIQHKSDGDFHPFEFYKNKATTTTTTPTLTALVLCFIKNTLTEHYTLVHRQPHTLHNGNSLGTRTYSLALRRTRTYSPCVLSYTHAYMHSPHRTHIYLRCEAKNGEKNEIKKKRVTCGHDGLLAAGCWHIIANILKRIKTYCVLYTDYALFYLSYVCRLHYTNMRSTHTRVIIIIIIIIIPSALPFCVQPKAIFDLNRLFLLSVQYRMQAKSGLKLFLSNQTIRWNIYYFREIAKYRFGDIARNYFHS